MLPAPFHWGWLALLGVLTLLALRRQESAAPPSPWLHVALAIGVVAWVGGALNRIAVDHGPALEVRSLVLHRPSLAPPTVSLGAGTPADAPLPDPWADELHAVVRWDEHGAWLWNASAERRLSVDGRGLHDLLLPPGAALHGGSSRLVVDSVGALTATVGGQELAGSPGRSLVARLPWVGERIDLPLAWVLGDGTPRLRDRRPLPDEGPVGQLVLRNGQLRLRFPSADDRARFGAGLSLAGEAPVRPADRWHLLQTGQRLVVGRTALDVDVDGDTVWLRVAGPPPRLKLPAEPAVWGAAPGILAVPESGGLALSILDPQGASGWARAGDTWRPRAGGDARVELRPDDRVQLPWSRDADVVGRLAGSGQPRAALAGLASHADRTAWRLFAVIGLLYLLLAAVLPRAGLLHARAAGVFHGSLMLFGLGLVCLYRLSDPGDPGRASWVQRQALLGALALGVGLVAAMGAAWRARRVAPLADGLLRWLDGEDEGGHRARWLYLAALAALTVQLPFGEAGIAIPGLGSVQPIEVARTLLVLHLAWWTARSVAEKRVRLRGVEGLSQRWRYMAHALPVLGVVGLCYGLHDISPILVFLAFLAVQYGLSLLRPSLRLWPPAAWRDHLALELVGVVAVLGGVGWLVLGDPGGTVARRLAVWWDPWSSTTDAYQAVTALWTTTAGGLWGQGWTGGNGVLPPAVQDDFVLALLSARAGIASIVLVALTFGVILLSGRAALDAPARVARTARERERTSHLAASMLWMLAIQAGVVIGSATGALPVMGQPLPFVASGGSHLLLFCVPAITVVLGCARVRVPVTGAVPRRLRGEPVTWWDFDSTSSHAITDAGA